MPEKPDKPPALSLRNLKDNWYVPLVVAADVALIWHPQHHHPQHVELPKPPQIDMEK